MGPRPSPNHVLDRIKASGNFTPANCRWVTRKEKLANSMLVIKHDGERLGVKAWANRLGMRWQSIYYRVKRCQEMGADLSEAVATPAGEKMPCVKGRVMGR